MIDRRCAGELPAKPHTALRSPEGALRFEQCLTRQGFDGPFTITYHQSRPHATRAVPAPLAWTSPALEAARPLRRRHLRSFELSQASGPPLATRTPLLRNDDVVVSVVRPDRPDPVYFVNGDGDDLYYIHQGGGTLRSLLGDVAFGAGDYLIVPKGILHRFELPQDTAQHWLSIECWGGIGVPRQWRNEVGQLRMDAPYSHRDFRAPVFAGPRDEGLRQAVVKKQDAFFGLEYESSPLDVVGWDGSVYPFAFPILAFQPRVSSVHLPPTWHGTFAARGALVCSFVPRPVDFHPQAIPCPYPHASVDCDEVIFYADGQFTSRRGVGPGSVSLHPAGLAHGPHPGAYEGSLGATRTDELAVMLDTFAPLRLTEAALRIEDAEYDEGFLGR